MKATSNPGSLLTTSNYGNIVGIDQAWLASATRKFKRMDTARTRWRIDKQSDYTTPITNDTNEYYHKAALIVPAL